LAEYGLYDESSEVAETSEEESSTVAETEEDSNETFLSLDDIPDYSGKSYYVVNDNRPYFDKNAQLRSDESYSELDDLGRCGMAFAKVSRDTMPERGEKRGEIGMIKPTGWHTVKYDCVDGNYLYNRCHLIGWQLGAENANEKNLVTGTRYMNLQMLEYENMVANYIYEGGEYVLYRVTPVYLKDELLCRGLLLEGLSDDETVSFNVFFYNVQPGIAIDYSTGENYYDGVFLDKTGDGVIYNE
jgi:DNA-entry nuclease